MKYIYVFDYCSGSIYEITISKKELDMNRLKLLEWLYDNYHLRSDSIHYMISDTKLEIETIEKV